MKSNKNLPYYFVTLGIFILLKFGYTRANNSDLTFLLTPTNKLVGLLTGSQSVFLSDNGYYHSQLNILIDKSCSGFNFWILCFVLFTYLITEHFDKKAIKILTIPASIIGAYLLTIFVNTSRIFVSIIINSHTNNFASNQQHILHEAIGIITNLTFLILFYILLEKILTHKQHNAKFT